jgi:hypothetical protein
MVFGLSPRVSGRCWPKNARSGQSAVVMQEQGGVDTLEETRVQALLQVAIDLHNRIGRKRNEGRLVELRLADKQDVFGRVVVAECKARKFSATQAGGVEQGDGEPGHRAVQW